MATLAVADIGSLVQMLLDLELASMMKKMAQDVRGLPADEVAKVVARLLRESTPRARVLVGTDAKILAFIERLPTPLRDWLIFRQLPKYG